MTRKKGGGRESGDEAVTQAGRPKLSTAEVERTSSAAANPAASCPCWKCKRIRALEAEVAYRRSYDTGDFSSFQKVLGEWKVRAEKAEARIAELEASR